jgi:large subunit ribosomal protein L1
MAKLTKKRKEVLAKLDKDKAYDLAEAIKLVKDITTTSLMLRLILTYVWV